MNKSTLLTLAVVCGLLLEGYREHRADDAAEAPLPVAAPKVQARAGDEPHARTGASSTPAIAPLPRPASTTASSPAPVRIGVDAPAAARRGDAFDVVIDIDSSKAIRRIAMEVAYDPAILRPRSIEEIEYGGAGGALGRFVVEERDVGRISAIAVSFDAKPLAVDTIRLAVAQFEAVAPGTSVIAISNIDIDDGQAPLRYSLGAASREIMIR